MRPLDPRLLTYAASARSFFAAGALLAVVQTGAVIAFAYLVTQLVVRAIDGESLADLGGWLAALAGVVVLRFAAAWLTEVNSTRGAAVVKSQLRAKVLDAVDRLGPGWLAGRNATAVGVTAGPGLDALDTYFSRYLPQLILTVVATPAVLVVIWWQDWISGLTVSVTLPLIPVFMVLIGLATQSVQQKQWEKLSRLSTAFLDVVGGLSTLTVFGRQHRQAARIRTVTDDYRRQTMKVLRISFLSGFALELAASLAVALVAVSIGVRLIDGSLGLEVGLFVLLLAPEAFLPLRNVGAQFHAAADGVAASTEVFSLLEAAGASTRHDPPSARAERADRDGSIGAGLELRGVGVRYGEVVAFEGLDARARAGQVTAVVGESGSGKSSLLAALVGFAEHEGTIVVDGSDVGGQPAPRAWLAWAGQRAAVLPGTVLENVTLGDAEPQHPLAEAALALAGAPEIGLDTVVDSLGGGLSGGQAQRVSAARAIYRARRLDCAVVAFDEPTSALDPVHEAQFAAGLRALADEGRAVVVVTHRPDLVAAADAVITVVAGEAGVSSDAARASVAATSAADDGGTR
ncbi:thiol reductant ABC exporter subunit CydD [Herbiconiux sp. KACC 21604]|uniref:thiol reductant ABC exporter subunit CydD n=1 Tax=unclassified Herbiconiux TaxID=2618217 RepID=UPI001492D988|nr:thiol reductant ABC exporter subunit CydD [Herbiconiux sp. SALV-R1]QJU53010.1 thiol reductant ABC exporter subunit CydD [Herbiconiux sp. SALV-R1]WPO87942.1 thiol reductant ABC exporter subunit CydD [Herbiconiux sp. KACC 21604]